MGRKSTNPDGTAKAKSAKKFSTNIGETLTGVVESVSFADGEAIVMEFKTGENGKAEVVSLGCESDEKTIDRLFTICAKHNHTGAVVEVGVIGDQIAWISR